jgi:hypothetical protein
MVVANFIPNVPLELAAKSKQKKFKTFFNPRPLNMFLAAGL